MSAISAQSSSIIASPVPSHLRIATLPNKFSDLFLEFESLVYQYMDAISEDYKGGYWEYIELSNTGFYMSLKDASQFHVQVSSNGFVGDLSADAASIIVNLSVLCRLANTHELDYLSEMFYSLRDYACEHPESSAILRAID